MPNEMTVQELLAEAIDWGVGNKSLANQIGNYGEQFELRTMAIHVADTMTSIGYFIAALAQDKLEGMEE